MPPHEDTFSDEDRAKLKALNISLPKGALIHFVNIRSMWRHTPDRYVACAAYAEFWGLGNKTIQAVVKAVAAFEGRTTQVAYYQGQKAGVRIVKVNGSPTVEPTAIERSLGDREVTMSGQSAAITRQICDTANGSDDQLNGPQECSTVQEPLGQRSRDRSIDEGINDLVNDQETEELRRTAVAVAPPIDRSKSLNAVGQAFSLYEQAQRYFGGPLADQQSIEVIRQALTAVDDEQAITAAATALHAGSAWAWGKGYQSTIDAGCSIHAALNGSLYELLPGETCAAEAELPVWNGSVWIEPITGRRLVDVLNEELLRAPAALNKERHQESAQDASEAITEASDAGSVVNSFAAPPSEHQEKMSQEDLRRQALVNFKPTIVATENIPSADVWAAVPDVSEDYFASAGYGRRA